MLTTFAVNWIAGVSGPRYLGTGGIQLRLRRYQVDITAWFHKTNYDVIAGTSENRVLHRSFRKPHIASIVNKISCSTSSSDKLHSSIRMHMIKPIAVSETCRLSEDKVHNNGNALWQECD